MTEINRIAFGSCNSQNLTNPLWEIISERNPDVFVWAGDAIYADTYVGLDWSKFPAKPIYQSGTPESIRQDYLQQKSDPSYRDFLHRTNATILGVLDDHDYGENNGDKTFRYKKESALAFLDFIGKIGNSDGLIYKRAQLGHGVYGVKVFDFSRDDGNYLLTDVEAGLDADLPEDSKKKESSSPNNKQNGSRKVAIFMLDVRSNRTPWNEGLKSFVPNYDGDFLGEKQWEWFEKSIQRSDASINIIVNGLLVHSYRFVSSNAAEFWSNFPTSRQRLYDAILQKNVLAPIIISGDIHMAQLMRKDCFKSDKIEGKDISGAQSRPIVEFTTSGMTHSWGTCFSSSNSFHYLPWKYRLCNVIGKSMMSLFHAIIPTPDLLVARNENVRDNGNKLFVNGGGDDAKLGKQYSLNQNFGEIEIDWKRRILKVRAIGKEKESPPLLSASFSFDQLSGKEFLPGSKDLTLPLNYGYLNFFMDGNVTNGEHTCLNTGGTAHPTKAVLGLIGISTYMLSIFILPHVIVIYIFKRFLSRKKK